MTAAEPDARVPRPVERVELLKLLRDFSRKHGWSLVRAEHDAHWAVLTFESDVEYRETGHGVRP